MEEASQLAASFMQSPQYRDLVVNGISPEGVVNWAAAGSVRVLREATERLAIDGWTSLEAALAWMAEKYPDQTPAKYGCRGWPHLLQESRQFELKYREDRAGKAVRFRLKAKPDRRPSRSTPKGR